MRPASVPWFRTSPPCPRPTRAGTAGFASERRRFAGRRSGVGDGSVSESESSSAQFFFFPDPQPAGALIGAAAVPGVGAPPLTSEEPAEDDAYDAAAAAAEADEDEDEDDDEEEDFGL